MGTKVRTLVASPIGGINYRPNQVVDMPAPMAKALAEAGQVDPHKDAVAYCINTLGAEVVVHKAAPSPEAQQLLVEIAQLLAKSADAVEADKPALQAAIDEKQAALAAIS